MLWGAYVFVVICLSTNGCLLFIFPQLSCCCFFIVFRFTFSLLDFSIKNNLLRFLLLSFSVPFLVFHIAFGLFISLLLCVFFRLLLCARLFTLFTHIPLLFLFAFLFNFLCQHDLFARCCFCFIVICSVCAFFSSLSVETTTPLSLSYVFYVTLDVFFFV